MLRLSFVTAALLASLVATQAQAVTLRYAWKPKATYRFTVKSTDQVDVSAMGVAVKEQFTTDSTFALVIKKVSKKGVAEGQLVIESFKVVDSDGQAMATIDKLPKDALKTPVEIDAKGNFTFKEVVYLVVDEESGANLLVSAKAGAHGASASATAGDEKVSVHAQFDPKTGQLSGGYKVEKLGKEKKQKRVEVKQEAQKVDLLPTQFLELLRLPEGDVAGGASFSTPMADFTIDVKVEEASAEKATLRTRVSTKVDTSKAPGVAAAAEDEGGDEPEAAMPGMMGMGGVPGLGAMPGMGGAGAGGAAPGAATVRIDGDFITDFGVKAGMLEALRGTLTSSVDAGPGVSVKNRTELSMAIVK